jgi:hypothetical protein
VTTPALYSANITVLAPSLRGLDARKGRLGELALEYTPSVTKWFPEPFCDSSLREGAKVSIGGLLRRGRLFYFRRVVKRRIGGIIEISYPRGGLL